MSETFAPFPEVPAHRILEELGRGASARVFRALDTRSGAEVVLKLLTDATSHQNQKRFTREVMALRALESDCIVRILDAGVAGDRPWYSMEKLDRRPLDRVLKERYGERRSCLSVIEAGRTLADVATALECAHAHGVVHRDIKPSNVLVDGEFHATLIDFGVARFEAYDLTKLTATGAFVGTPAYAAPEQLTRGHADARSDIYAFGLLGYELLSGRLPFDDFPPMEMLRRRKEERIPPLVSLNPTVPAGVDRIVMKCLEADPPGRYGDVAVIRKDLTLALGGEKPLHAAPRPRPPAARPSGSAPPSADSATRAVRVAALAALLTALGAAGIYSGFGRGPAGSADAPAGVETHGAGRELLTALHLVPGSDSITVEFRTAQPALTWVRVTAAGRAPVEIAASRALALDHRAVVLGLAPATAHAVRVVLQAPDGRRLATDEQSVRTRESP